MSQENVEIVRKLYESQGSDFYELLDPHVVWLNYASAPEPGPYLGHEGVREWAKAWRTTFGDFEIHPTEIVDVGGDQVVVVGRVTAAGTRSGAPVDREMAWLFTLLNGRIVQRGYAALNRRDYDVVLMRSDPDVEYRPSGNLMPPDLEPVFYGHDGYRKLWSRWFDAFEDLP